MNDMTPPVRGFTQTDRIVHREWSRLSVKKPYASALMHILAEHVGDQNAVTASYRTLAELMGVSVMTVRRAAAVLVEERWIEIVRLGSGGVNSYVINSRVVWAEKRDGLKHALFTSAIIASASEQDNPERLGKEQPLRQLDPFLTPE